MILKKCITCKKEKETTMFSFRKDTQKYRNECKECEKARKRKHYEQNIEKIKQRSYDFYHNNIEHNKLIRKEYRRRNKSEISNHAKEYYKQNKEKVIEKSKEHYYKNREAILSRVKNYQQNNKAKRNTWQSKRKKDDKIYHLKCELRNMIYMSFKRKNYTKKEHAKKILGCSTEFFVNYLLQTFKNNYGYEWDELEPVHIDHIKPLKNAQTEKEVIKLCKYTNLQLLKAVDNIKKSSNINYKIEREG